VAQAVIFQGKKAIYFLNYYQHFSGVLLLRGLLAQFLPAFSRLTLHRIGLPPQTIAGRHGRPTEFVGFHGKQSRVCGCHLAAFFVMIWGVQ
jgi:hypothetical protein